MRRGEAGSTLIERPNNNPVPDFHECQGKGYRNLSHYSMYCTHVMCMLIIVHTLLYRMSQSISHLSCFSSISEEER